MRYIKSSPRVTVKFVDSDTEDIIFEVKDRTWMNVGELLNDAAVDSIMKHEFKGDYPKNLMVLAVAEFELK